jgi:hypothetical protein
LPPPPFRHIADRPPLCQRQPSFAARRLLSFEQFATRWPCFFAAVTPFAAATTLSFIDFAISSLIFATYDIASFSAFVDYFRLILFRADITPPLMPADASHHSFADEADS